MTIIPNSRFVYVCAGALLSLSHLAASDWPMYLYDPAHSSYVATETQIGPGSVTNLEPAWTFSAQGFGGAPTVIDGVVYIGDWGGNFYAVRASDGSLLWRQYVGMATPPPLTTCQPAIGVTGQAVIQKGTVYVPGGDAAVYALNQNTGQQLWKVPLADPTGGSYLWSSLTLVNNSFFLGIASLGDCPLVRGALVRFDLTNPPNPSFGYVLAAGDIGAGIWSTPALDVQTNTIYATTGNGNFDPSIGSYGSSFLSINATTLAVKNAYPLPTVNKIDDDDWGSSPTLFPASDGTPLVAAGAKDGVLYVAKRSDMSFVWSATLAGGCDDPFYGCGVLSTPAWDGSTLYVGAGNPTPDGSNVGTVYAFTPNGSQLWKTTVNGIVVAPVTVSNGLVFVSTLSGFQVLDANKGTPIWDDGGAGAIYSQPVVCDGTVYVAYASGTLTAYRLSNGTPPPAATPGPHPPMPPHR